MVNEQNKKAPARPATPAPGRPAAAATAGRQDFVRSVIAEMRRVTWPTREEWISATVLTIVLVVGIGLFTYAFDQLFGWLFQVIHPIQGGQG